MKSTLLQTLILILPLYFSTLSAQSSQGLNKYWVQFKNKTNSPYNIKKPEAFLSSRAIHRRKRQQIPITHEDLPVNPGYTNKLRQLGVHIQHSSKWLNGVTIVADEQTFLALADLNFISNTTYIGKHFHKDIFLRKKGKKRDNTQEVERMDDHYGYTGPQIKMVKGDILHDMGYKGEGMLIAVMDGGFSNTDIMPFFDHLHSSKKFVGHHDFVDSDREVFEASAHGSQVLSVMAANLPGLMVGTAPEASYVCIRTEDNRGEYRSEEYQWIAGLEYADSLGVDVVNSSLGYSTFSDKKMDYTYADLNGQTSPASRAADMAFSKGMIVVNAVGNSGDTNWKHMDVPADSKTVFSVGATDIEGERAKFSSQGPTADGRIKPDVSALGRRIGIASIYSYKVTASNGTSYAAPLIAGAVAALWQAFPYKSNQEILEAVKQSASQALQPDNQLGYGIPDFYRAYQLLEDGKGMMARK